MILSGVRRLYKRGIGLTTGFIELQVSYTQQSLLQLQLTLTTESQLLLSLFRAQDLLQTQLALTGHQRTLLYSEDSGSNSETTAATNSYGILTVLKSKSRYDRRPVSPGFKAHVGLTTGYLFLLTFTSIVLSMSGAPSDERSGLSFVIVIVRPLLGTDPKETLSPIPLLLHGRLATLPLLTVDPQRARHTIKA
jgi:hypothetical protein